MIRVESLANDRVRRVLALQRSTRRRLREGLMVAEGHRLVSEMVGAPVLPVEVFVTEGYHADDPEAKALIKRLASRAEVIEVTDEVMAAMADTVTPQGILAVLQIPDLAPVSDPTLGRFILIADQVRDPGNLGTMLRTAWAAGVTQVLLPPGTVDPTNPKVVRAGMGAHFYLPVHKVDWDEIWLRVGSAEVWLAEAGRGTLYDRVNWQQDAALVIGGEASGAGKRVRQAGDYVQIPMARGVESVNAAVAAAVILFEAAHQRRMGSR
jgi:TrmH family RNA methyltransferase